MSKQVQLSLSLSEQQKTLLEEAAKYDEQDLDSFVLVPAIERARTVLGPMVTEVFEMTSEEALDTLIACRARLAQLEGEPMRLWSVEKGRASDPPEGGWLLHLYEPGQSYIDWYADEEAARAALIRLAEDEEKAPSMDRTSLDLTYTRPAPAMSDHLMLDPTALFSSRATPQPQLVHCTVEIRPNDGKIPTSRGE